MAWPPDKGLQKKAQKFLKQLEKKKQKTASMLTNERARAKVIQISQQ